MKCLTILTKKTLQALFCFFFLCLIFACDPEGKKDCAWVLEPEPELKNRVDKGFIPVCARNRKTKKQDCRLQTTLEKAKGYYGRKFRYSELKVKDYGIPRTITDVRFCD